MTINAKLIKQISKLRQLQALSSYKPKTPVMKRVLQNHLNYLMEAKV
jgi:hypothetical protein